MKVLAIGQIPEGVDRAAEQLRQVLVELKMVPVREQVGIPAIWAAFDEAGEPRHNGLDGALDATIAELLWWATALIPARGRSRDALIAGVGAGA